MQSTDHIDIESFLSMKWVWGKADDRGGVDGTLKQSYIVRKCQKLWDNIYENFAPLEILENFTDFDLLLFYEIVLR